MEELQQRKRELDAAMAENRRETKRAKQQAKDDAKAQASAWALSPFLRHAALVLYVLTGYATEPVVKFLMANGRKRHWPEKTEEELILMIEQLFLDTDLDEAAALTDLEAPADVAAMKAALKYSEQWRVVEWTRSLNSGQGLAPSTDRVLVQLEQQRQQLPESVRPCPVGTASQASARVWAAAWRRRWGGKHAHIKLRDDVPQTELLRKAIEI